MRVVLDTNVIVSAAIISGGKPDQIVRRASASFLWLTSGFILDEVAVVLSRRHIRSKYPSLAPPEARAQFLDALRGVAEIVNVTSELTVITDDVDDNPVLACAVDGRADYLVTGDRHLLALRIYAGIAIVTPEQFLGVLDKPQ